MLYSRERKAFFFVRQKLLILLTILLGVTGVPVYAESAYTEQTAAITNSMQMQAEQKSLTEDMNAGMSVLTFEKPLTKWEFSEAGDYLYAIFANSDRLTTIRTSDWTVVKETALGTVPADLAVIEDKVYVALPASNEIGIVTLATSDTVQDAVYRMQTVSSPVQLAGGSDQLFFTDGITTYVVDAVYGKGRRLNDSQPILLNPQRLLYDEEEKTLYIATNSHLAQVRTPSYEIAAKALLPIFTGGSRLVWDKEASMLYYSGRQWSLPTFTPVVGHITGTYVLFTQGNNVFAGDSLYEKDPFRQVVAFSEWASAVHMDRSGRVFVYFNETNRAVKYDSLDLFKQSHTVTEPPAVVVDGLAFSDSDNRKGRIYGPLTWRPSQNFKISHYNIYYLDKNKQKIGAEVGRVSRSDTALMIPYNSKLPNIAKYFGVYASNQAGESSQYAFVPIQDQVGYDPLNPGPSEGDIQIVELYDRNPNRGQHDLFVKVQIPPDMTSNAQLEFYYTNYSLEPVGERIKRIAVRQIGEDQTVHLGGDVPQEANQIMLRYSKSQNGQIEFGNTALIWDNVLEASVPDTILETKDDGFLALSFEDDHYTQGQLEGNLSYYYYDHSGWSQARSMIFYFLDEQNQRIQPILEAPVRQGAFVPFPIHTAIPAGAVRIGVFPKTAEGNEGAQGAYSSVWDRPFGEPTRLTMWDRLATEGLGEVEVSWELNGPSPHGVERYELHALGKEDINTREPLSEPLAVWLPGQDQYKVVLPVGSISDDAHILQIFTKDKTGSYFQQTVASSVTRISDNTSGETWKPQPDANSAFYIGGFSDTDGDLGQIGGNVSWMNESGDDLSVRLYFTDEDNNAIQPVVSVRRADYFMPSYSLPKNTVLPEGAAKIKVTHLSKTGEKPAGAFNIVDRIYTPALTEQQITIENHPEGKEDTVTITGLHPLDQIKVYRDETIAYPLVQSGEIGTVSDKGMYVITGPRVNKDGEVTLTLPQLGKESGSVFVTIHHFDYRHTESVRVEKKYAAEGSGQEPGTDPGENPGTDPGEIPGTNPGENPGTDPGENPGTDPGENPGTDPGENSGTDPGENPGTDPGENSGTDPGENPGTDPGENPGTDPGENPGTDPGESSGTNPGGGSGNNPGTGSGSNPPPAIGGGGGGAPSQPQQADSTYTPQLTSETSNGVAYQVANLDAGKLAEAFKQTGQEQQSAVVIDLKDAPNAKVNIPAEAWLAAAAQADGGGVLSIRNATVAYDLPASVFQLSALAEQLGVDPKDLQITVTFTEVNETVQKQIDEGAKASGLSFIAPPVEFTVAVSAGDKQIVIDNFGDTYVTRTILLPQSVNPSDTVAVRYDPATGSLHFVPALFETKEDGTTEAKLMRQGNSIYAIAQATPRVFTDVQQHWAKREIEQLAAKLIVNGQDEQRFGPDLPVTRAEFAALLVRALGISEQRSAKTAFRDVPADAWYAGAVAAASDKRLVEGDETGAFAPNERITREQMAVMITRALRLADPQAGAAASDLSGLSAYADRDEVASWAQAAVAQTVQTGLMQGTQPGRFEPGREASRAEAAVMLQRLLQHVGFMNR